MRHRHPARCWQNIRLRCAPRSRFYSGIPHTQCPPPWRPASVLDEWVEREVRPISLRQLTFFGRTLTESRLISSANYVRTELPTRIAHRLRDMQKLPYVVVANPHISFVYELYYKAFERFRVIPEIRTLEDNDRYCAILRETLREHLTVIPNLAMGVLECQDLVDPDEMDRFMNTILRARISRRVIAEQHLALTETFNSPWHFPDSKARTDLNADFVGEVFLKCNAKEVVERCGKLVQDLLRQSSGSDKIPEISVQGHLETTFPYILSHLEYIIGELLRNSIQAVIEKYKDSPGKPPPIEVLICEAPQHVIIRISDQGGGVPREILPYLWSFSKGPRTQTRLKNLGQVPTMAATMQELTVSAERKHADKETYRESSLASLSSRPPNLRLGMGLPMSRVYAEYWAGSLELHSLEGYGVDAFLQISKLGNKNEQVTTRASIDAV
ncbi:putative pyruvate dehydrogenase kinase [Thermoascus aurantiacus ATCC 26904]